MRDSVVTEVRWGAGAWCCRLQWCCAGVVPLLLRKRMPQGVVRLRMCMQSGSIRMLARRGCRPGCPLRLAAGCCLSLPHYQTRLLRLPCTRRSDGRLKWWLQVPNQLELSSTSAVCFVVIALHREKRWYNDMVGAGTYVFRLGGDSECCCCRYCCCWVSVPDATSGGAEHRQSAHSTEHALIACKLITAALALPLQATCAWTPRGPATWRTCSTTRARTTVTPAPLGA